MRDTVLWILLLSIVIAMAAFFVADGYKLHHGGHDCYPGCTFKQNLADYGMLVTFWLVMLLAIGSVVRWIRLGRRSERGR